MLSTVCPRISLSYCPYNSKSLSESPLTGSILLILYRRNNKLIILIAFIVATSAHYVGFNFIQIVYLVSYAVSMFYSLGRITYIGDIKNEEIFNIIMLYNLNLILSLFCSVPNFVFSIFTFMFIIIWLSVVIPDSLSLSSDSICTVPK